MADQVHDEAYEAPDVEDVEVCAGTAESASMISLSPAP